MAAALVAVVALLGSLSAAGCAGRFRGPRRLATAGAALAGGGAAVWSVGERRADPGVLPTVGFFAVALGVAAIVAAGGWIATEVACRSDPDCDESEECREIPAPPGGVPYKQCMPR